MFIGAHAIGSRAIGAGLDVISEDVAPVETPGALRGTIQLRPALTGAIQNTPPLTAQVAMGE